MITSLATDHLNNYIALTKHIDFEDSVTRTSYERFTDINDPENFGSASVAFMRIHLVLQDMLPLIQMLNLLGSESPFIKMYNAMVEVQKDITPEGMNDILAEAKDHAGITEEDLRAGK